MSLTLTAIELDEFLPHPPAKVWRALTEPALIAAWLMENDFEPVIGHRYTMRGTPVPAVGFSGLVASEVLEIDPERLLRISWRDAEAGNNLNSTVTWTLVPEGGRDTTVPHPRRIRPGRAESCDRSPHYGWRLARTDPQEADGNVGPDGE